MCQSSCTYLCIDFVCNKLTCYKFYVFVIVIIKIFNNKKKYLKNIILITIIKYEK